MRPARSDTVVPAFAALGDETRWRILTAIGDGEATASALARTLPVSRQAIARHLAVLEEVGLVESLRIGRESRFRVVGAEIAAIARRLERIAAAWGAEGRRDGEVVSRRPDPPPTRRARPDPARRAT